MSLLSLMQDVALEIGLPKPTSVVNSTNQETQQLLRFVYRTGQDVVMHYNWPQLVREATITLVADQANYALPSDYLRQISGTHWNQDNSWQMGGPISPQEWNLRAYGITNDGPRDRFRVKGIADNQFYITPTPGSGDAGVTLSYEYLSSMWFRPPTWVASTAYSSGDYVFYDGVYYYASASGTSGAVSPADDITNENVLWLIGTNSKATYDADTTSYFLLPYAAFTTDNDVFFLDEDFISLGVVWRWLRSKGHPYKDIQADYEMQLKRRATNYSGSRPLSLVRRRSSPLLSSENVPDTGYGQ